MKLRLSGGVLLLLMFLGLQVLGAAKKNITVSLDRKEIRDLTSRGLILVFFLKVANSSSSPFYLEQADYRVVVEEKDYFSLKSSLDEPILVPPGGETSVSLPVKVTYALLFEAVGELGEKSRLASYVTGLMMFSDGRRIREKVPFAFSADFPVFQDLGAEIHPLEVNALSLGGAELTFAFTLKNPNSFDLELNRSVYQLKLGGKVVAEGSIRAGERIESRSEKRLSLPLILDFFELGRDLQAVLERPAAECELVAELEASTVWGEVKVEVSKKEAVAVEKKGDDLRHHPHL